MVSKRMSVLDLLYFTLKLPAVSSIYDSDAANKSVCHSIIGMFP